MTTAQIEPPWVADVLHYWFEEVGEARWFAGGEALDAQVRERFGALHGRIAQAQEHAAAARTLLAAVIVLDQFSRHLFRHTARAFATDEAARRLATTAIAHGFDAAASDAERMFFYLPFQHSEDAADQARSVELFTALGNEEWLRYAVAHQAIIDRFGRFPHRNAILGRQSTADEIALLKEPMGAF